MAEKKTTAKKIADKATPKPPTKAVAPVAEKPKHLLPHQLVLSSNTQNAVGILAWSKFAGEADLQELVNNLGEQTKNVQAGDMRPVEGMLYRQAKTLETMFTSLARRAANQDGLKQFQVNLTLALKAQAQCRATLEALALVKNPMPYIRQANIANGPQQVNNGNASASGHTGISTPSGTHAGNFQSEQTKLLEADHGQRLDTRAAQAAGRVNQAVGTVG